MSDVSKLPDNPHIAVKIIDAHTQEKGIVGKVFGTPEHAHTNIAAIAVILIIVLLGLTILLSANDGVDRSEISTALLSALTFLLGLIFGRRME